MLIFVTRLDHMIFVYKKKKKFQIAEKMQNLKIIFRSKITGFIQFSLVNCNYRCYSQFKILFFGTDEFSLPSLKIL